MQLEIKRVSTATIEFNTHEELCRELHIPKGIISRNIWDFCESGQEEKLSEDSLIFLEELVRQNRLDTNTYVECEVDYF